MINAALKLKRHDSGFTLIEIVLVSALLAILSSIVYGTVNGLLRTRDMVYQRESVLRTSRSIFGRLLFDLQNRMPEAVYPSSENDTQSPSPVYKPQRPLLEGLDKQEGEFSLDSIRFVTGKAASASEGELNSATVEVSYRIEKIKGSLLKALGEDVKDGEWFLIREQVPTGIKAQEERDTRRSVVPIAKGVRYLNLRYYAAKEWADQWTQIGRLPDAVEITVGIEDQNLKIHFFKTAVALQIQASRLPY